MLVQTYHDLGVPLTAHLENSKYDLDLVQFLKWLK